MKTGKFRIAFNWKLKKKGTPQMPYIPQEQRDAVDTPIAAIIAKLRTKGGMMGMPGMLNYVITKMCWMLFVPKESRNYSTANAIVGVLECAKAEFIRRQVSPYEDEKIAENGDIMSAVVRAQDADNVGGAWDNDQDKSLRSQVGNGVSIDTIARNMGRTSTAIIFRFVNLQLSYGAR